MSRRLFWLLVSLLIALLSGNASASEPFPPAIQTTLSLTYTPACTLCHDTLLGGTGTANQPVGRKVRSYGLMAGDTQKLITILGQMNAAKDDSDHDGMSDIDELKANRDPNINDITGEPPEDYPPPVYGCHAGRSRADREPQKGSSVPAAASIIAILWLRFRMQQRRTIRLSRENV